MSPQVKDKDPLVIDMDLLFGRIRQFMVSPKLQLNSQYVVPVTFFYLG